MRKYEEYDIGTELNVKGTNILLKVTEATEKCEGCFKYHPYDFSGFPCLDLISNNPKCKAHSRKDKKDIIFLRINN